MNNSKIIEINNESIINIDGKSYPVKDLTFQNLRKHFGTGRAYTISGTGRDRVTGYRSGIMTDIGDVEEELWEKLVLCVIERNGEQELYQNLLSWLTQHPVGCHDAKRRRHMALELHAMRIFDDVDWCDWLEFTCTYRPELLPQ